MNCLCPLPSFNNNELMDNLICVSIHTVSVHIELNQILDDMYWL